MQSKYPVIEAPLLDLPDWQKELIDARLKEVAENPGRVLPIDSLLAEL